MSKSWMSAGGSSYVEEKKRKARPSSGSHRHGSVFDSMARIATGRRQSTSASADGADPTTARREPTTGRKDSIRRDSRSATATSLEIFVHVGGVEFPNARRLAKA